MARGEKWRHGDGDALEAYQFVFPVAPHRARAGIRRVCRNRRSPPAGRCSMPRSIYAIASTRSFQYDQQATTVATSVAEVLKSRRGVCQDFAHFMIACLRSLGLAARYVSGYLTSAAIRIGGQASHAWVSVFFPGLGWLDLDPTNDQLANGTHVTLAWGRDYSDVAPVKGVAMGGGHQSINVSVGVVPE
jgi:transglutaminase-like putative cysteine protease